MTDEPVTPRLRELLSVISAEVQTLGSQTLRLARLEISATAWSLAWAAVGLLASVLVAVAGAGVLVSALVLVAITLGLPAWGAATLVGVLLTVGGTCPLVTFSTARAEWSSG